MKNSILKFITVVCLLLLMVGVSLGANVLIVYFACVIFGWQFHFLAGLFVWAASLVASVLLNPLYNSVTDYLKEL